MAGVIFQSISDLERNGDTVAAKRLASKTYEALMSSSPNIATYTGRPDQQLDLLAIAQATPYSRKIAEPMVGELAYAVAYGYDDDVFVGAIEAKTDNTVEQLQSVHALERIANWAINNGDWADPAVHKVLRALDALSKVKQSSPLARKVALAGMESARQELSLDWVSIDELPSGERDSLLATRERRVSDYLQGQTDLHRRFPELATDQDIRQVSRDAAVTHDRLGFGLMQINGRGGTVVGGLDTVRGSQELSLTAEEALLISEMQRPAVRELVETDLGMSLNDTSFAAQLRLLEYMSKAKDDEYEALSKVMLQADPADRLMYAETFLSLDYGSDLAASIVNIAENSDPAIAKKVFETVASYRTAAENFSSWFAGYSPELAQATAEAMNERLADGLATIEAVATDKSLDMELGVGGSYRVADMAEAMNDMRLADKALGVVIGAMSDKQARFSRVTQPNDQFDMYRISSQQHGEVILYVRPEGAKGYDSTYEYGNRHGGLGW